VPRAILTQHVVNNLKFSEHSDNHRSDRTSFQSIYTGSNHQKFRIQDHAYKHISHQAPDQIIRQKLTQITRIQATSTRAPGRHENQNTKCRNKITVLQKLTSLKLIRTHCEVMNCSKCSTASLKTFLSKKLISTT
jgi:phosphoketolase